MFFWVVLWSRSKDITFYLVVVVRWEQINVLLEFREYKLFLHEIKLPLKHYTYYEMQKNYKYRKHICTDTDRRRA